MNSNGKTEPPQGKKRGVRLNKPQDVRRLLSRLINQTMRDEISIELLKGVTYACNTILKSLEAGELSDRLTAIERKLLL